jgi:hypothetical protein
LNNSFGSSTSSFSPSFFSLFGASFLIAAAFNISSKETLFSSSSSSFFSSLTSTFSQASGSTITATSFFISL